MNVFKEIWTLLLVMVAVLPFLWWGQICMRNSIKTRGWLPSLFFLAAILILAFLFFAFWPRAH